jgi:hypothetical protein
MNLIESKPGKQLAIQLFVSTGLLAFGIAESH